LLPLLAACSLPARSTSSARTTEDALFTAAAQTIAAGLNQTSPPPAATDTPAPFTPTPSETASPSTPPATPAPATPAAPVVQATTSTNCRLGPDPVYESVGSLLAGEQATALGRDRFDQWWYIENPDRPGQNCWVWSQTTALTGETASLAVITPLPPPTATPTIGPSFTVAFAVLRNCGGQPTVILQINNTGGNSLESLSLQIEDRTAGSVLFGPAASDAPFMGSASECPPGGDSLPVGQSLYVGGGLTSMPPQANALRASVQLCTADGLKGSCQTRTLEFKLT
jgi:hypothetical protein